MTDDEKICLMIGLFVGCIISVIVGKYVSKKWESDAIKSCAGYYDRKTGELKFVEIKR